LDVKEYDKIYTEHWDFQLETIKYLNTDLNSLFQILVKANKQVFLDYDVDMTDNVTISSLAVKIFLKDYYGSNKPVINKASIYKDIKKSYYDGITEVYKPYGENLHYYDVNSLYPYTALQDIPGLNCTKFDYYSYNQSIKDLFVVLL